jgi:hypothetical protein
MSNPYKVFGNPPSQMLGRTHLAERVLNRLRTQHVSVVGPRYIGKKIFLNGIIEAARSGKLFDDVVYWDLRRFAPESDGQFFNQMAEKLRDQITSIGEDIKVFFAKPEDLCWSSIKSLAEHYRDNKKRILIVFDGMDQALGSTALSRSVWDNLCALADHSSIAMLTSSRKRLRQLCADPTSRTSDFWERFVDPVELKVFTQEELREFLEPLSQAAGGLAAGVETEIGNWTGGMPVLVAAVCQALADKPGSISTAVVHGAARHVLEHHVDLVEALWQDLDVQIQTAFVALVRAGELPRTELAAAAAKLLNTGLAIELAGKIKVRCRLLAEFSAARGEDLTAMTVLFAARGDFERNLRTLVDLRLNHIAFSDSDLRDFITNAVDKVAQPKVCLTAMRGIAEQALTLIWKNEAPNGEVPHFTSDKALTFIQKCDRNKLPVDLARQCQCLDFLTDQRNGVTPGKVNRKIFCLVSHLKSLGDLGQHQGGMSFGLPFSALACLSAVQLAEEMSVTGLA